MKMHLVALDVWLWRTLALTALATVVTFRMMILVSVTSVTVISYVSTGIMCRQNTLRLLIAASGLLCR